MTQPERIEVTVNLVISSDPDVSFGASMGRMLCDLVEEATRRGMEVGARMVLDAESTTSVLGDEDEAKPFPGFLGATTTDDEDYYDE